MCFHCFHRETLPLPWCVSTAFAAETLPLPLRVPTALAAERPPFLMVLVDGTVLATVDGTKETVNPYKIHLYIISLRPPFLAVLAGGRHDSHALSEKQRRPRECGSR